MNPSVAAVSPMAAVLGVGKKKKSTTPGEQPARTTPGVVGASPSSGGY